MGVENSNSLCLSGERKHDLTISHEDTLCFNVTGELFEKFYFLMRNLIEFGACVFIVWFVFPAVETTFRDCVE